VGLLRVEGQDLEGEVRVRREEHDHLAQAQDLRRGEPVAAVRGPEASARAAHGDQGIEEAAARLDLLREPLRVGGREIALEGRGLDRLARERRKQEGPAREGLAVGPERGAPRRPHVGDEGRDLGRVERERHFVAREAARLPARGEVLPSR
jgi:hypothetical protein